MFPSYLCCLIKQKIVEKNIYVAFLSFFLNECNDNAFPAMHFQTIVLKQHPNSVAFSAK